MRRYIFLIMLLIPSFLQAQFVGRWKSGANAPTASHTLVKVDTLSELTSGHGIVFKSDAKMLGNLTLELSASEALTVNGKLVVRDTARVEMGLRVKGASTFGATATPTVLSTDGSVSQTVNSANAAKTALTIADGYEPTTGQTGSTSDIVFTLKGTSNSGSSFTNVVSARISAYKTADFFNASGTNDNDGALGLYYTTNGTEYKGLSLTSDGHTLLYGNKFLIFNGSAFYGGDMQSSLGLANTRFSDIYTGGTIYSPKYSADALANYMVFQKSRHATVNNHTIVQDNDVIGGINFAPSDGTDFGTTSAQIKAEVDDASPAASSIGGALVFSTAAGAASDDLTERMRIDKSGNLGIGTTAPVSNSLTLGTKGTQRDLIVTRENVPAGIDSSLRAYILAGNGRYVAKATDADSSVLTVDADSARLISNNPWSIAGGVTNTGTLTQKGTATFGSISTTAKTTTFDSLITHAEVSKIDSGATIALATGVSGWGEIMVGNNQEWAHFRFTSAGLVTLIANSANVDTVSVGGGTALKVDIYDAGTGIAIRNNLLKPAKKVAVKVNYFTP